jgi:hypothetical protein
MDIDGRRLVLFIPLHLHLSLALGELEEQCPGGGLPACSNRCGRAEQSLGFKLFARLLYPLVASLVNRLLVLAEPCLKAERRWLAAEGLCHMATLPPSS